MEFLVSLHTAARGGHHGDAAAPIAQEPMSSPKIAGAGRVRLHVIDATIPWKIVHQTPCHLDIRQFLLVAASNFHLPAADAFGEEQRRCKLGAFFDTNAACCCLTRPGAANDGRKTVVWTVDAVTQLAQGVDQGGLWSLMHTRDAAHAVAAVSETQERRKEACSCAGIFDKELEWLRECARVRNGPAAAVNGEGTVSLFDGISRHSNVKAQTLETIHHR